MSVRLPLHTLTGIVGRVRLAEQHDTYADRMNILSLIYNIPHIPHSPGALAASISASADSTRPSSPNSSSPGSDSDTYRGRSSSVATTSSDGRTTTIFTDYSGTTLADGLYPDEPESDSEKGTLSYGLYHFDRHLRIVTIYPATSSSHHPYAAPEAMEQRVSPPSTATTNGTVAHVQRDRTSSQPPVRPYPAPAAPHRPRAVSALPPDYACSREKTKSWVAYQTTSVSSQTVVVLTLEAQTCLQCSQKPTSTTAEAQILSTSSAK